MVPLTPETPPNLGNARILICSGRSDPIVSLENVERLGAMLRDAGADITLRFEDAGHQLVFAEIAAAKDWLREP
jgi:predicted esterase